MQVAALAAALLAAAFGARADTVLYRYVDERGTVHFTDAPPRQRAERVRVDPTGVRPAARLRDTRRFDPLIERVARQHGLPPALVKAVVASESGFDPQAVSRRGALGLMQLMPATAARLGVFDPFHPEQNLAAGTRYLRELIRRYGDWSRALAAYNAGPRVVDRYRGLPPFPETREYVRRVLHYYRRYDGDFPP